jgi:site-specific DNA-methyltransferase (adenine-specific)
MTIYYQDDLVTLYHGDCLEELAWLEADVLVTDPPYGINAESKKGAFGSKHEVRRASPIAGDRNTDVRDDVLVAWAGRPALMFGSWRATRPDDTQHILIWWKRGQAPGPANMAFMSQHEEIYVLGSGFKKTSPPMRSVIETTEPRQGAAGPAATIGHPTPKPIGLMETLIERCPPGIVADPFAGSGATLVAARNLGRKAIGVELEEKYCEIIATRLSQQAFNFEEIGA